MTAFTLEALPNEILLLVLSNLCSCTDLRSLCRVSAISFRLFQADKKKLLDRLLGKVIHHENLQDGLCACEASTYMEAQCCARPACWMNRVLGHHGFIHAWQLERFLYKSDDICELLRLERLSTVVDRFACDYAQGALARLQSTGSKLGIADKKASSILSHILTRSERGRFQRAFYRFEISRKLWLSMPQRDNTTREYSLLFHLGAGEREEVLAVYDYLIRRAQTVLGDLEVYLASELKEIKGTRNRDQAGSAMSDNSNRALAKKVLNVEVIHSNQLPAESPRKTSKLAQHLIGLGLPFFAKFLGFDRRDQIAWATSTGVQVGKNPFVDLFRWNVHEIPVGTYAGRYRHLTGPGFHEGRFYLEQDSNHTADFPNWASGADPRDIAWVYNRQTRHELRSLGYVFWDDGLVGMDFLLKAMQLPRNKSGLPINTNNRPIDPLHFGDDSVHSHDCSLNVKDSGSDGSDVDSWQTEAENVSIIGPDQEEKDHSEAGSIIDAKEHPANPKKRPNETSLLAYIQKMRLQSPVQDALAEKYLTPNPVEMHKYLSEIEY